MTTLDEVPSWVDWTRQAADDAGLDAFEVRGDFYDSVRHVRLGGEPRGERRASVGGVGVRAFLDGGSGYAHTTECEPTSLRQTVERARRLAAANAKRDWRRFAPHIESDHRVEYRPDVNRHPRTHEGQQDLLERAERAALEVADMVVQTSLGYRDSVAIMANSAGGWVHTESLVSTLLVQTVAKQSGRVGDGAAWAGGERGLGDFEDAGGPEALGKSAAEQALEGLHAVAVDPGRYRTMYDPHLTGLLCHESFGHLTEYDVVAAGWSVLQDRLGDRLAPESITIRDAPTAPGRSGVRVPFDHEGEAGRPVTLLDQGRLDHFMHARDSAASEGLAPTGNARALNVRHPPIVRMRNTFVEPGDHSYEECLETLGNGLYLQGARGGTPRCDGSFLFTAQRGYEVKNGELGKPVRMVSIHGNVLDFFDGVEALSDRFDIHTNFFGGCGKWDQSFLHVGTGGPHVVAGETLVGGQGA